MIGDLKSPLQERHLISEHFDLLAGFHLEFCLSRLDSIQYRNALLLIEACWKIFDLHALASLALQKCAPMR